MTIKIFTKHPKKLKYNMAIYYGVSNKDKKLTLPSTPYARLFLRFFDIDLYDVAEIDDRVIVWHGGIGGTDVLELAKIITQKYYKAIEPAMWGDAKSKKIRGNKGDVDIYLYREDMIICQ